MPFCFSKIGMCNKLITPPAARSKDNSIDSLYGSRCCVMKSHHWQEYIENVLRFLHNWAKTENVQLSEIPENVITTLKN